MPIVHIDLVEGRSPERIEELIRAVSEAVATALESPLENVRVIVNEMSHHQYGVGGRPWTEVIAERRAAGRLPQDEHQGGER